MRRNTRRAALAAGGVLAYGVVTQRVIPRSAQLPANLGAAASLVLLARRWDQPWTSLGLDPREAGRGVALGAASVPPIAGALAVATAVPSLRAYFHDERVVGATPGEAARHLLVRVPLATALAEELLFRSALLALFRSSTGRGRAIAATSLVFGVWHVLPAVQSHRSNPGAARAAEALGGAAAVVAGTVVATTAAGVALSWLRQRARSVVAPVIAHAALNSLAFLATRRVARARTPL